MPDPNKMRNDVMSLADKINRDISSLTKKYKALATEVDKRFRDELRVQSGDMDGLDDFYRLMLIVKKNAQVSQQALFLMSKMVDISKFDISEEVDKRDLTK